MSSLKISTTSRLPARARYARTRACTHAHTHARGTRTHARMHTRTYTRTGHTHACTHAHGCTHTRSLADQRHRRSGRGLHLGWRRRVLTKKNLPVVMYQTAPFCPTILLRLTNLNGSKFVDTGHCMYPQPPLQRACSLLGRSTGPHMQTYAPHAAANTRAHSAASSDLI